MRLGFCLLLVVWCVLVCCVLPLLETHAHLTSAGLFWFSVDLILLYRCVVSDFSGLPLSVLVCFGLPFCLASSFCTLLFLWLLLFTLAPTALHCFLSYLP